MSVPQLRTARCRHSKYAFNDRQLTHADTIDTLAVANEMLMFVTNANTLLQQLRERDTSEEELRTSLATLSVENATLRKQLSETSTKPVEPVQPKCHEVAKMLVMLHNAGMSAPRSLMPSPKCRCEPCLEARDAELERLRSENQRLLNECSATKK